jgi:hypothetical protein
MYIFATKVPTSATSPLVTLCRRIGPSTSNSPFAFYNVCARDDEWIEQVNWVVSELIKCGSNSKSCQKTFLLFFSSLLFVIGSEISESVPFVLTQIVLMHIVLTQIVLAQIVLTQIVLAQIVLTQIVRIVFIKAT